MLHHFTNKNNFKPYFVEVEPSNNGKRMASLLSTKCIHILAFKILEASLSKVHIFAFLCVTS